MPRSVRGLKEQIVCHSVVMAYMTIVFMRCGDLKRPVLKVTERKEQVVVALRGERNEHLSVHRDKEGTVIATHWSPDLASSTWDALRVEVARKLRYRDPERHGHYVMHRPLFSPVVGADGHFLIGRRINIESAKPKRTYERAPQIVIEMPARECMVEFILSTPDRPFSQPDNPHVRTAF